MQALYTTKRIRKINWNLCNSVKVMSKSDSYQVVLDAVIERATLNDGEYDEKRETHEYVLNQTLCEHQAFWH